LHLLSLLLSLQVLHLLSLLLSLQVLHLLSLLLSLQILQLEYLFSLPLNHLIFKIQFLIYQYDFIPI